jgi:hypothetical protein
LLRPFLERCDEAVLDHLLRQVEIAEGANQRSSQPADLLAEDGGDCRFGGGVRPFSRSQ